jgi:MerR family transcriptional regulator, mercuric resistance operon regulatory protein
MGSITASRGSALTIGALARLTGVSVETIRYYERIRLMGKPPRTRGGHRCYEPEHTHRLRFIRRARDLGFSIEDIRTLLALSVRGHKSCAEVREIAAAHLADVRAKRDDLAKLESILSETVDQCDAHRSGISTPICPILQVLES